MKFTLSRCAFFKGEQNQYKVKFDLRLEAEVDR
jgi:hypothetical protein